MRDETRDKRHQGFEAQRDRWQDRERDSRIEEQTQQDRGRETTRHREKDSKIERERSLSL